MRRACSLELLGNISYTPVPIPLTQVYLLLSHLLPDFSYENWTSCKRGIFDFPDRPEGDSDFIYLDRMGQLAKLFGLGEVAENGNIIYYLEVKSTSSQARSFHLSQHQFQTVNAQRRFLSNSRLNASTKTRAIKFM